MKAGSTWLGQPGLPEEGTAGECLQVVHEIERIRRTLLGWLECSPFFGCSDRRGSSASSQPRSGAVPVLCRSWGFTSSTREAAEGFHVHLLAG